ncbi:hypothetical protein WN55_05506 [Dufourea novaeangliae]|uniref:Uncharacterized protein n=1 Tax=Dufourea novaeangliae TaxID=178035 RepID=A0A154PMI7_DUFNO|nr:hypothetical protein WN55_05506 [Dufourea novaeangliae]
MTKDIVPSDIGLVLNRSVRPYRAVVSASIVASTQLPSFAFSMYDTKNDIIGVSPNKVLSAATVMVRLRAPWGTDFGDYATSSSILTLIFSGYYNGTITYSGTIWFQLAPHKVASKVSDVLDRFSSNPRSSNESGLMNIDVPELTPKPTVFKCKLFAR